MPEVKIDIYTDTHGTPKTLKDVEGGLGSVDRAAKAVSMTLDDWSRGFTTAGTKIALVGGVITGALGLMVKTSADAGDNIAELSKRTGIGTEALSAYKLAADKSGASIQDFAIGMRGLADRMNAANTGNKEATALFKNLGIQVADNTGKLRPLDEVMLDVADKFSLMADGAVKTATAQDIFGRSGMQLIPMLNMGRKGLEENAEAAKRLGLTWSEDAARAADEFNDSVVELKGAVLGLGQQIGTALMPEIKNFIDRSRDAIAQVRQWAANHPELSKAVAATSLSLGAMLTAMGTGLITTGNVIRSLDTLQKAFKMSQGAIAAFTGAISAGIIVAGYYIGKLLELAAAEDYARDAGKRNEEVENKLVDTLSKAAVAAGWHFGEMSKLIEAHKGNIAQLTNEIRHGEHGIEIQKALAEVSKADAEAYEKWRKEMGLFIPTIEEAEKKLSDFQELQWRMANTITDIVIPSQDKYVKLVEYGVLPNTKLLNDIVGQAPAKFEDMAYGAKSAAEKTVNYMSLLYDDIRRGFASTIKDWMNGLTTFRDFWKGIWGNIKDAFFNVIAEMVANWTVNLAKGLIGEATKAASSITETLGSAVKGIGTGIKELLIGLGEGIAGMAKAIAGAAKEILIAAGVALAIYAGFKVVSGLLSSVFGGGGKQGDVTYWLKLIWENSQIISNRLANEYWSAMAELVAGKNRMIDQLDGRTSFMDATNSWLRGIDSWLGSIESNTRSLKDITKAQGGWSGVVNQPTLFVAGERGPEHVTVTPNINIRPGQSVFMVDGMVLARAITPYLTRLERDGIKKSGY